MSCVLLTGSCHHRMTAIATANTPKVAAAVAASLINGGSYTNHRCCRYDYNRHRDWNGNKKGKKHKFTTSLIGAHKKRRLSISLLASSTLETTRNSSRPNFYQEVLEAARENFTEEISFQSKDKDVSLAKALLYVAAEDEAFMAFNREMDARSLQSERSDALVSSDALEWECLEEMPLAAKSINEWLSELDSIAKEVKAELVSRDIGCHLVEVLEAVNLVLFQSRGFKRSSVLVDPKYSYLHSVLRSGYGSAILLSVIYIEVCRRLNLTIVGSRVGEDYLIWPQTENPEELFKVTSGHSLFGIVNGRCVDDPKSKASDLSSNSLSTLDIATNRDTIGIALANLQAQRGGSRRPKMGRSTASCLKIIACGSNAVDKDDVEAPESKGSSDKRGWSFRKRSASHRVRSNTVISEVPSSLTKESRETATVSLLTQPNATFPDKTSAIPWTDERPRLPTSVNLKVSDSKVSTEDDTMHCVNPDEPVIVVIQAAIRGFMAQREMLKLKNVVKLQAAVRGHLVRRQAVGTLRCVQAIVKMQALVRARRARFSSKGSCIEGKRDGHDAKDDQSSKLLEMGNSVAKPNVMYISIEKLLTNKFAYQLLESTPRTKRIQIKCDPSGSDAAWNWLERWMSASSVGVEQPQKPESKVEQQEQDKVECSACQVETGFPSEGCESTDLKANIRETVVPLKSKENLLTDDTDNLDFQASQPTSSSKSDSWEPSQPENSGTSNSKGSSLDLLPNQAKQSDSISQMELKSITSKPEMESEQSTQSVKRFAPEQVETEGKKFGFGTRKATNPAFIAVQSKFEELSSTANSARSTSTNNQDVGVESNSDAVSYAMDNAIRTREISLAENSVLHTSGVKVGDSECGTEISISSTLDSPDRSEIGAMDVEQEPELSEEKMGNPSSTESIHIEANGETTIPGSDSYYSISVQPEKPDDVNGANGKPVISVTAVDCLHENQKSETNAYNVQLGLDSEMGHRTYKSSSEASPRSHMTVLESQETPSTQVSVKAERTKSDRGASNQKRRSLSEGKKFPSNLNHDSGVRSSLENSPKEQKTGKQRKSFGSGRPDYVDQERRDSNSSNSLPSYMQATESARAKSLANSSPRSSPDVQDKDVFIKKRHSLPGANGRQGSPRIRQSLSPAQLGAKGNGNLHERKWQR